MNRTRARGIPARAVLLLIGAAGAGLLMPGQAQAETIGLVGSLPLDDDCANGGQARLAPVTNADVDLGREVVTSCQQ